MFGKSFTLFRLFGFAVKVDWSWLILGALITWSLAHGLFPQYGPVHPTAVYWWMGAAGAVGLFFSIVFHEMSHSLVARRYGLPMKGITLFIFGGVSEMTEEPKNPTVEFKMAVAGPLASVFLSLALHGFYVLGARNGWPFPVMGLLRYLAGVNGLLAAFNLLPAFPLDGGRVLRAALWRWKGDIRRATRIASRVGSGFGTGLIILGVLAMVSGNFIGGLWGFMIGMFLRNASAGSYQQVLFSKALEGETVSRFMKTDPVTAPSSITVRALVEDYIYRHHFKMFPVMDGGRLIGCVTTRQVRELPREEWEKRTVRDLVARCPAGNTVSADTKALEALAIMNRTGNSRLVVVAKDELVGIVTLKDMLKFISLKVEMEGESL